MLRDYGDVHKLLTVITSRLMTDPFSADEDEDDISPLINIATFVRMSVALAERLVNSLVNGTAQMTMFVEEQRLNTNSTNFGIPSQI